MLQPVEKKTAVNSHFTDKKQEIPNTTHGIGQVHTVGKYILVGFVSEWHALVYMYNLTHL